MSFFFSNHGTCQHRQALRKAKEGAVPETHGFERRDGRRKMRVCECVRNSVYDCGVDLWCVVLPLRWGSHAEKAFLLETVIHVNFGSTNSLGTPFIPPRSHPHLLSPGPLVYLHHESKVVLGVGGQSHSRAFLPAPDTSCWHELSVFLLRLSHTGHRGRILQLLLCHSRTPVLAFSRAMVKGSLICLLAIFLPSPGDDSGL